MIALKEAVRWIFLEAGPASHGGGQTDIVGTCIPYAETRRLALQCLR